MNRKSYSQLVQDLEDALSRLKKEESNIYSLAEKAIGLCAIAYTQLKTGVNSFGFASIGEEIEFFKKTKPQLCSYLTFYRKLATIESHRPAHSKYGQINYLKREINKLNEYYKQHKEFIEYIRSGQTYADDKYFRRYMSDLILSNQNYEYVTNPDFSTVYDITLSKIMAYERLEMYLYNEIGKLNGENKVVNESIQSKREWNGNLTAYTELLYALKETKVINHGNVSIKELHEMLGQVLDLPKGNIYSAFRDIHSRKKEKTVFLDKLKEALIRRIDQANE